MKDVVKRSEYMVWQTPLPNHRRMGVIFERDITPTRNIAVGNVVIPVGEEQQKVSVHPDGEEIYYIVRGYGRFYLDDRAHDVEPGTAVYVGPGVGHRCANTGKEELELFWVNTPPVWPVGGYVDNCKGWERVQ